MDRFVIEENFFNKNDYTVIANRIYCPLPWRPFEDELNSNVVEQPAVDPDWDPFPLRTKEAFEDLETMLSTSLDHFLCLVDYFKANSEESTRFSFMRHWIRREAVVHFKNYIQLQNTWLFSAICCAWYSCSKELVFSLMTKHFLHTAKRESRRGITDY